MEHCSICKRSLDQLNDLLSANCGGDCLKCMASAEDPECVAHVNSIPDPKEFARTMFHSASREDVIKLWATLQRYDSKFVEPGVWYTPPIPTWIQLMYLSARS